MKPAKPKGFADYDHSNSGYSRSVWENFSICPEVSMGPQNAMILCDENTLCQQGGSQIFNNLKLIVNCHEDKCNLSKYKIGSCSSNQKPKVLVNAVHQWHSW